MRTSAMTMAPTSALRRCTNLERIIDKSCLRAGFVIFTNSVWFLMNFSPVYLPTVVPVTVSQASIILRCSKGVSNPWSRSR